VLLVELFVLAWALVWDALVHFFAVFTGCNWDTSVTGGFVPFNGILIRLAD
jgi:hypothetical protein